MGLSDLNMSRSEAIATRGHLTGQVVGRALDGKDTPREACKASDVVSDISSQ